MAQRSAALLLSAENKAQQESRFLMDGVNIKVSLSIGVAEIESDDTADTLLMRADMALYNVKSEGRNGVRHL